MATTTRFALRFPELGDAPNGPQGLSDLASDVEGWLTRAFPCTSTTRPASPPTGMLIRESDTGLVYVWTGSAWVVVSGSAGSATAGDAQYQATAAQSIPNAADTVIAFGVATAAHALVTRIADGPGHRFQLEQAGVWTLSATLRYASVVSTAERAFFLRTVPGVNIAHQGSSGSGVPVTANLSCTRRFAAGTQIFAGAFQGTGSALVLEPNAGNWCQIDLVCHG